MLTISILNTLNKQLPINIFFKILFLLHRFPSLCVNLKWMKPSWFSSVVSGEVMLGKRPYFLTLYPWVLDYGRIQPFFQNELKSEIYFVGLFNLKVVNYIPQEATGLSIERCLPFSPRVKEVMECVVKEFVQFLCLALGPISIYQR
jgi:hypothetical protein